MQIILTEDVDNLGQRGQVVRVAAGYGRNYLIPKGLALPATTGNLKIVEEQRTALAKKEAKFMAEAEVLAADLTKHHVVMSRKAGDTGVLFGSVTNKDIADILNASGYNVDRRKIRLEHPLKAIGNHHIEIDLHSDVKAQLLISVAPEEEEPVSRMLHKGEESDKIFQEVEARVKAIQAALSESEAGPQADEQAPSPDVAAE